jgi:pimeloyl-ACP methyl ester carboxylesterase
MQERSVSINNHSIFYRVVGNGKPVAFIHGFGEDGSVWNNQVEYLKNKFRFIIPDLPGSGRSELIDDMSIEGMAGVIKEILDKENSQLQDSSTAFPARGGKVGAIVIGHSMGGYIALAVAEKYPGHLNGLGLFHSTSYADTEEKKVTRRKGIEFIQQHGGFEFLKTSVPNLFSPNSKDEMPGLIDEFISSLSNFQGEALVSYYEAMMQRPDRISTLKNAKVPVLFIAGTFDNAVPLKDCLEQCHLPEKSYFHVLEKSGHMGMIEEAKKSNEALEEYLANLE